MKICLVGAEMFHRDEQIDTIKITAIFCNFANAFKEVI
jgi:hypothetical protein